MARRCVNYNNRYQNKKHLHKLTRGRQPEDTVISSRRVVILPDLLSFNGYLLLFAIVRTRSARATYCRCSSGLAPSFGLAEIFLGKIYLGILGNQALDLSQILLFNLYQRSQNYRIIKSS